MFKIVIVRKDSITHESEFRGWFAETYGFKCFTDMKQDNRTQSAFLYRGHKSPDSSDIVWTLNTTHHN